MVSWVYMHLFFMIDKKQFTFSIFVRTTNLQNMNIDLLQKEKDPMGTAIMDYHLKGMAGKLRVFSPEFDEDEIPVDTLFRSYDEMPVIERTALDMAYGKILDVGAGSGCHSIALEDMDKTVEAIDISPLAVEVMQEDGVKAHLVNIFDPSFVGRYDTILMLMNGAGIIGSVANMEMFFTRMKSLLSSGGCILMDSSDISYLFEDEEEGMLIDLAAGYYGEIEFTMQYKRVKSESFKWLYIDFDTLDFYASMYGFKAEKVCSGEHYDYLAKLTLND